LWRLIPEQSTVKVSLPSMPDEQAPGQNESSEWKTIRRFQRTPFKLGCLGCSLTGWTAIAALLGVVVLLAYLVRRLWF
jgi:hypothetical protein